MLNLVTTPDSETPRALGRIAWFDERSRAFPVRTLFKVDPIEHPLRGFTWQVGVNLDQGREGACVGFGFTHELAARPQPVPNVTNDFARNLYFAAQQRDEWEGGAYPGASPTYEGTSVLAGAKTLVDMRFYREFRWAFNEREVAVTVGYRGPVVIGVNWYDGMFHPNGDGFISPSGNIAGGHCILIHGVNVKSGYYKLWNSWGPSWGQGGTAKITRDDMARLLSEGGEACLPIRQTKRKTPRV